MEKNKQKILKTIGISIILAIIYEVFMKFIIKIETNYLIDKIIVDSFIFSFIGFHITFGIKNLYDFIIEHRYKIAIICVIVFTLLGYSGSSNGVLTNWFFEKEKSNVLFGANRSIRSDEYGLETPLAVSQKYNNYKYTNDSLRGADTDVFSIVHAPIKDILSLGKLYNLGYFLLSTEMALAFYWNLRFFGLILISYELFSIITNKNKLISIVATIMLVFSGAVQWTYSNAFVDILLWGQLALVLLDKFMISDKFKTRLLCLIGITISAISYVFTFYPAYMICLGYIFFALAIWIIIKNRKKFKITLKDIISIVIGIAVIVTLCLRYLNLSANTLEIISNTSYPGDRIETGGNGIPYLFTYLYNFLLPFINMGDNCALASIISIFPVPMLMAIYYIYKKEKHVSFLLPVSIVAILESVFCISGFPEWLSNITLFKYTIVERVAVTVNFANFYLLIYMISNIQENLVSIKSAIRISLVLICVAAFVPLPTVISSRIYLSIFAAILCLYTFLFLNNGDARYRKVLLTFLVIFTIIGGLLVNPITKGVDAITETDFAKEIKKITKEDEDALWITTDNMMILANYAVANGAKTLNSTNIYPNKEMFELVLGKENAEKQKDIWNRYAHIEVIIAEENKVELVDKDKIRLYLTTEKIKQLNVKYIISYNNLFEEELDVKKIYENRNKEEVTLGGKKVNSLYIYEVLAK